MNGVRKRLHRVAIGDQVLTSPATGKLVDLSNGTGSGTLSRPVTDVHRVACQERPGYRLVLRFPKGRHTRPLQPGTWVHELVGPQ